MGPQDFIEEVFAFLFKPFIAVTVLVSFNLALNLIGLAIIINLTSEYENDGSKLTMSSAWFLKFGTRIIEAIEHIEPRGFSDFFPLPPEL